MSFFLDILRRLYTFSYVGFFKFTGKRLSVGNGTIISPLASLVTGDGSISIGENCYIAPWVVINTYGGDISIGNNVSINYFSVLYGHGGLTIGDDCRIATHTVIIPSEHNFQRTDIPIRKQGNTHKGISIGNDVWIGANVTVLDGSQIGTGCVVGANSTTKGELSPYGIYVGAPAQKVRARGE